MMSRDISNYKEAIEYLFNQLPVYQRQGRGAIKKSLDNIKSLCRLLDEPHLKYPVIHIAGTNGKGSVTHMLSSYLMEQGYTVGLYTSPHYRDFRERIKIGRNYIPESDVLKLVNFLLGDLEEIQPSFFEITVAMAFGYFAQQQVDIAVIETGLGGRLDSTNIVDPVLSIITNISYDHEIFLGDTLEKIAGEKAGIIKGGKPVLIGEKHPETVPVFEEKSKEQDSSLSYAEELVKVEVLASDYKRMEVEVEIDEREPFSITTDCPGDYQQENIRTTIATSMLLEHSELEIQFDVDKLRSSLSKVKENTGLIGRYDLLNNKPVVLVDSAHNEDGIRSFWKNIDPSEFDKVYVVAGFVQGKDVRNLLSLFPQNVHFLFARPNILRGMNTDEIIPVANELGLEYELFESVHQAKDHAVKNAGKDDAVIIVGSCYLVAEVI